jgi:hypothetical protein
MKPNNKIGLTTFILLFSFISSSICQTPVWNGKGRIVISSDGNEHDHDDWAATPLSLAVLSAAGLQDKLALYTYSDHIWGSNQEHPTSDSGINSYEHMRESALGAKSWFGFGNTRFVCAVDNAEVAYIAIRDEINKSSADDPLFIIAAGPMQVVGEGINRADASKRQFVTLISHSNWNNVHSDRPSRDYWDVHTGWTFNEISTNFSAEEGGSLKCVLISDQNGGVDYEGLMAPIAKFDWLKDPIEIKKGAFKDGSLGWLYSRLNTCIKNGNIDASDAGMIVWFLTGNEKTDPKMAHEIMISSKK